MQWPENRAQVDCPDNGIAMDGGIDSDRLQTLSLTVEAPRFDRKVMTGRNILFYQPDGTIPPPSGWDVGDNFYDPQANPVKVAMICTGG